MEDHQYLIVTVKHQMIFRDWKKYIPQCCPPCVGEREEKKAVEVVSPDCFLCASQVVLFKALGVPAVWMCHCGMTTGFAGNVGHYCTRLT